MSANGDDLSDFNSRMNILRRQREAANRLAALSFADLVSVRDDMDMANSTIAKNRAAIALVRGEKAVLRSRVGRLPSEPESARTQQEEADS